MPQINVSVAMMQMRVETDALQKNLTHADQLLTEVCYTRQVDFAVFPETADLGWATAVIAKNAGIGVHVRVLGKRIQAAFREQLQCQRNVPRFGFRLLQERGVEVL